MKIRLEGSLTIFSALSMVFVLSFLLLLLEGARLSGLKTIASLAAQTGMDSAASEYQPTLWEKYRLLYLDGAYGSGEFDIQNVISRIMEHTNNNLAQSEKTDLFSVKLCEAQTTAYMLATDYDGIGVLRQASAYMKEHLPEDTVKKLYDQYKEKEALEKEKPVENSVEEADKAIKKAKEEKTTNQVLDEEKSEVQETEKPRKNLLQIVLELKENPVLGMVVADVESLSDKTVELKETVSKRQCKVGKVSTETMTNTNDFDWTEKVMLLEYLNKYFSDYTKPGEGDFSYEMEYILCGKDTDRKNLEATVEKLILLREAANVMHILANREKLNETSAIAASLAGFSGNPAIIKTVQIGVVAAWAYVESILDIRTLLAGGKIAMVKTADEWTTDASNLGEAIQNQGKAIDCENGLSYQTYLKQLFAALSEKKIAYRMMDIMEFAVQKEPGCETIRMDDMIGLMNYELCFQANPFFAKTAAYGKNSLGRYVFWKNQQMSYVK